MHPFHSIHFDLPESPRAAFTSTRPLRFRPHDDAHREDPPGAGDDKVPGMSDVDRSYGDAPGFPEHAPSESPATGDDMVPGMSDVDRSYGDAPGFPEHAPDESDRG